MVEQKISLDFSKNGVQRTVHARQGENAARDILISLVSNGEPVDVSSGEYVLWVIYPDGSHSIPDVENPVKVTIPQALCLTVGEKICEIQVRHSGDLLYSPQFRVQVEGTILGASGSSEPIGDPTTYEPNIAVNATEYTGTLDDVKIPVIDPTTDTTKWISPEGLQPDLTELRGDVDDLQEDVEDIQEELENIGGTEIFDGQFNAAGGIVLSNGKTYQDIIAALTDEKMVLLRVSDAYSDLYLSYRGYNRGWVDTPQALMYGYSLAFGYDSEYERRLYAAVSQLTTGNTFNLIEYKYYTATEKTKLAGIESGAQVNVQPDWEQDDTTADDYIKNKPSIPVVPALATVATSGSYNDLTDKPTIPSISGLEETANKVTSISSSSTDTQYPSAKCVYDIVGDVESALSALIGGNVE